VSRVSASDALFNVAREIDRASSSIELPSYDQMSSEAKSLLGVFLDFNGISREKIAAAWPSDVNASAEVAASTTPKEAAPLFTESETRNRADCSTVKDSRQA
jgi:hypothetical protein